MRFAANVSLHVIRREGPSTHVSLPCRLFPGDLVDCNPFRPAGIVIVLEVGGVSDNHLVNLVISIIFFGVVAEALGANGGVVLKSKSVVLVGLGRDSVRRNAIVKEDCSNRHMLFVSIEDHT